MLGNRNVAMNENNGKVENVVATVVTNVRYAQIIGQGRFIVLNIADNIIGKFKNDNDEIVEQERSVIKVATAYLMKQLIEHNNNVASAMRRSKNVSSTLCATIEGATIKVEVIRHKAGEAYNDAGDVLDYDKFDYKITIEKLDDEVINLLKQAKRADFGL